MYNGIGQRILLIQFRELLPNSGIDFILKIYGERLPPNDVFIGNLTNRSVLVDTYVLLGFKVFAFALNFILYTDNESPKIVLGSLCYHGLDRIGTILLGLKFSINSTVTVVLLHELMMELAIEGCLFTSRRSRLAES